MTRTAACCLLVLACVLGAAPPAGAGDDRPLSVEAFEQQISRLRHPMLAERDAARRHLAAAMPGVRQQVISALDDAPWVVRLQLAHILASDGSQPSTDALLRLFESVSEVEADAIRQRVLRDEVASQRMLERLEASPKLLEGEGKAKSRLRAAYKLLKRAQIEETFLSRKSDSGSTGYYRGQYDDLKPDRKQALDIVTHIALDEALQVPGRYKTGRYQFIRVRAIELWELRDMAMNAVAELGTADDHVVIARLVRHAGRIQREAYRMSRAIGFGGWSDDAEQLEDQEILMEVAGQWGDALSALYIIDPTPSRENALREYMDALQYDFATKIRYRWWSEQARAATAIRVGWYPMAVELYKGLLGRRYGPSDATSHYNLACAYASWSLDPPKGLDPEELRELAIAHLSSAVSGGWTDLGWMEEDRDLDPIRKSPAYRALVRHIQSELGIARRPADDGEDSEGGGKAPEGGEDDDDR